MKRHNFQRTFKNRNENSGFLCQCVRIYEIITSILKVHTRITVPSWTPCNPLKHPGTSLLEHSCDSLKPLGTLKKPLQKSGTLLKPSKTPWNPIERLWNLLHTSLTTMGTPETTSNTNENTPGTSWNTPGWHLSQPYGTPIKLLKTCVQSCVPSYVPPRISLERPWNHSKPPETLGVDF